MSFNGNFHQSHQADKEYARKMALGKECLET